MKRIHSRIAHATLAAGVALSGASIGAAEPTIRIGVLSPNTGPYAAIGEDVRNGFQLYLDEVGAKAGGARLELVFEDSQAKPDVGLTKARKLVESDKVAFLSGVVSSSVAYALRDYVVEKNIPFVVSVSSADGLTQQLAAPNIFRTNSSGSQASHPFGKWLYDKGYRRLILVATGYSAGFEQTGGIARTFTQAGGKIVQTLYPPLGTADFAPFLSSLKVKDADAVAAVFAGSEAIKFVKQYDEYGLKATLPLVSSSMLTDDMILEAQGKSALGILSSSHYSARVKTPENEAFVEAYQKRFGRTPTFYSEGSYVAARAIGETIKALDGDVSDKARVSKTLAGVKFAAPRGAFRFDDYRSPVHDIYVFEVKRVDGKLVNEPVAKVPDVSQFYTWQPKAFLEMKPYRDIANEWAK